MKSKKNAVIGATYAGRLVLSDTTLMSSAYIYMEHMAWMYVKTHKQSKRDVEQKLRQRSFFCAIQADESPDPLKNSFVVG